MPDLRTEADPATPPPADDPLLPLPDTYDPADLARAFIREALSGDDPEWWRSNNPNGAAARDAARTALGIPPAATPDGD